MVLDIYIPTFFFFSHVNMKLSYEVVQFQNSGFQRNVTMNSEFLEKNVKFKQFQ